MLQRLPIALTQVNAGNTSENLLNETRHYIFSVMSKRNYPASKYWSPGHPEDIPLQRPQDVFPQKTFKARFRDDVGSSVGCLKTSFYFSFETYLIDQIYLKAIQYSRCIQKLVELLRWSVNYFRERTSAQKLDWVLNTPLIMSSNVNSHAYRLIAGTNNFKAWCIPHMFNPLLAKNYITER